MKKRVVVTGLGMVTPLGTGVEKSWEAICHGKSGIDTITRFDTSDFKSKIAGEIKDFCAEDYIPKKDIKKMCIFIHYAIASSLMAQKDAALEINEENDTSVGVIIGSGLGGLPTIEENYKIYSEKGPSKITPFFTPKAIINLAAGQVSIYLGAKGPNVSLVTACATGTHSIGDGFKIIQRGDAKVMIAGGTESTITPLGVGGFSAMKALSTRNDDPTKASRPFERDRDGFVMGEGAGILILEELEYAKSRGARIYAEIIGYGLTGDAYHMTSPSPNGEGAARCIKMALNDAGISPNEVDYINAHGTSTKFNDLYETMAIKSVFGDYAYKLPVSSTKSMTGHLLGASGAVEANIAILSIRDGLMPPTINYDNPDPECDLDYIPNQARKKELNTVLSNSFGFGGTNASILFRKYEE